MRLSPAIAGYDHVLVALNGCVWIGDEPMPGAREAMAALREAGIDIVFLTNDPRRPPEEHVRKLWSLGFQAALDEVVTAGGALQYLLARDGERRSAFVIGARPLIDHVADAGLRILNGTDLASRADVVVVSDHDGFDYAELRTATQAVQRGAELIGMTREPAFPMPDGPWPGTGAILAAVETASGRRAHRMVGMPEPAMYEAALDRLGPGRALAVGDSLEADVAGARRLGLDAALVLSGAASADSLDTFEPAPTHVAASLAALVLG